MDMLDISKERTWKPSQLSVRSVFVGHTKGDTPNRLLRVKRPTTDRVQGKRIKALGL